MVLSTLTSSIKPGITLHLPPKLYVSGSSVEGEVELDFGLLRQDNIEEVHVKLRGIARTVLTVNTTVLTEQKKLVWEERSLWTRAASPGESTDTRRFPFRFDLPPDLPPSFAWGTNGREAFVSYRVVAVGARPGALRLNRRVKAALAVVPRDAGTGLRARERIGVLGIGEEGAWRTEFKEEKIRKGLWGDYATVQVKLLTPDVPVLPLYVPIPFEVHVRTLSPPLARAKADAYPENKDVFPPVPDTYGALTFKLRRKLFVRASAFKEKPSGDVAVFTKDAGAAVRAEVDVPPRRWVPLDAVDGAWGEKEGKEKEGTAGSASADAKGVWVQEAHFRSTFTLNCPTTFALDFLKCDYYLALEVPFPGLRNDANVEASVTISSGLDASIAKDEPGAVPTKDGTPDFLDLPPAYWDTDEKDWDDMKD
ncbi:hypothetical protein BD413DRAFT_535211 [Trametes elegans]|nr:hypothetical protein BD413DRAFT_535211 [Trametes elegans]